MRLKDVVVATNQDISRFCLSSVFATILLIIAYECVVFIFIWHIVLYVFVL